MDEDAILRTSTEICAVCILLVVNGGLLERRQPLMLLTMTREAVSLGMGRSRAEWVAAIASPVFELNPKGSKGTFFCCNSKHHHCHSSPPTTVMPLTAPKGGKCPLCAFRTSEWSTPSRWQPIQQLNGARPYSLQVTRVSSSLIEAQHLPNIFNPDFIEKEGTPS